MKIREAGTVIIISFVILCAVVGVVSKYVTKQDDGIVEEFMEDRIQDVTGYDIDLSPSSPEE